MKGIVFTEFMELVESKFGEDTMEDMLEAADLSSDGSYTSVGTYDHNELVKMVEELSKITKVDVPDLIKAFGNHLGVVFYTKFTTFFEQADGTLEFLKSIDDHIHVEVAKLYPDAELPVFAYKEHEDGSFHLFYSSTRGFSDLAHGLIEATSGYYKESFSIEREDSIEGSTHKTHFVLTPS